MCIYNLHTLKFFYKYFIRLHIFHLSNFFSRFLSLSCDFPQEIGKCFTYKVALKVLTLNFDIFGCPHFIYRRKKRVRDNQFSKTMPPKVGRLVTFL